MAELKPPLGAKPSWIAIPERIQDLAEAIVRCKNDTSGELLDEWAYEIALLSRVNAKMSIFREVNQRQF